MSTSYQQPPGDPQSAVTYNPPTQQPPMGKLSIVTLILAFFAGIPAVILGIFALRQNWANGTRGTGIAWAGIIIGAVIGVMQSWAIMLLIYVFTAPGFEY